MNGETQEQRRQALVATAAFGIIGLAAVVWLSIAAPKRADTLALLFPPGFHANDTLSAIAKADGRIVRFGAFDNIIVAKFDGLDAGTIIDRTGALFALDPKVPGACIFTGL